jgi:hypothetical protein
VSRPGHLTPQRKLSSGHFAFYESFAAWLTTKHDPNGTGKTATHRAYRKEAERLLLWTILEQRKPLSSLTVEDANAFKWFLVAPPERWCGRAITSAGRPCGGRSRGH